MVEAHAAVSPARDRILEAAERVVAEVGAARLTLDVVAQAAGVSKGGLLYHFPSKRARPQPRSAGLHRRDSR